MTDRLLSLKFINYQWWVI